MKALWERRGSIKWGECAVRRGPLEASASRELTTLKTSHEGNDEQGLLYSASGMRSHPQCFIPPPPGSIFNIFFCDFTSS